MGDMQGLPRLLLIEDDHGIADALVQALATSYLVDHAPTGKLGLYRHDTETYAAIILDLNLPDASGLAICQQLRERGAQAPILILSGQSQVLAKINLLDAGADDYLTKPFSLGELKARLRVLERRASQITPVASELTVSGVILSARHHEVRRDNQLIQLRRKEFVLLNCLMERAGKVVSRETLTRYAWQGGDDPWTNTIDVHIKYLRDKLDRPFETPLIRTVHGLGYRFEVLPTAVPVGETECPA